MNPEVSPRENFMQNKRGSAYTTAVSPRNNYESTVSGIDSSDRKRNDQTLFEDWAMLTALINMSNDEYKATLEKVSKKFGGFPDFSLRDLPPYRTEMTAAINRTTQ